MDHRRKRRSTFGKGVLLLSLFFLISYILMVRLIMNGTIDSSISSMQQSMPLRVDEHRAVDDRSAEPDGGRRYLNRETPTSPLSGTAPERRSPVIEQEIEEGSPATVHERRLQLREKRLQRPIKCPNSTRRISPISLSDRNWAPYYFRCNDLLGQRNDPKQEWLSEALISKEMMYAHVFKAGGTSIQGNILTLVDQNRLHNFTSIPMSRHSPKWKIEDLIVSGGTIGGEVQKEEYSQHSILNDFINRDTFIFSFVRDPIDKFLSAFLEVNYRSGFFEKYQGESSATDLVDKQIKDIQRRLEDRRNHRLGPTKDPWVNAHLRPNMYFLTDQDHRTDIPFNFIGDLKNFKTDFHEIMMPFIVDDELKRNRTKFMELNGKRNVVSDKKLDKFRVHRSELSDEDIAGLCDLYWLDYLCFPFDIPPQCDIDKLFYEHYGIDVEYKDCY